MSVDYLQIAKYVLSIERDSIDALILRLGDEFNRVVSVIVSCQGRVVLSGVGKSGHIARKIASTLASTGTPAFFVHAGEAGHGDLGMITKYDVLIALSNSGETDEVINIATFAKRFGALIVAITGNDSSTLKSISDHSLDASVEIEACPLGVAPTSSTIVQLALGDAIAMATLEARGFSTEDFARTHPNGSLGRRLFIRVKDVMKPIENVPHAFSDLLLLDGISLMTNSRAGAIIVLDHDNSLLGIFTDSDLRRLLVKYKNNLSEFYNLKISDVFKNTAHTINIDELASEALRLIEARQISRLICLDQGRVAGMVTLHDLIESKIS